MTDVQHTRFERAATSGTGAALETADAGATLSIESADAAGAGVVYSTAGTEAVYSAAATGTRVLQDFLYGSSSRGRSWCTTTGHWSDALCRERVERYARQNR